MDVFLIPAGPARYELYCEVGDQPDAPKTPGSVPSRGWRRGLFDRFTTLVGTVEAARHGAAQRRASRARRTLPARVRDRAVCWLAEKIAEQRLLWHLRSERVVTAWFPDDLAEAEASDRVRQMLRADADRHTRWLLIDGGGLLLSTLLIPVPGPNLVLYYFAFRVVGHYLSRHGARHGLEQVEWQMQPSGPLTDLREAMTLDDPDARQRRVADVAGRLHLRHLAAFFERIAVEGN